VDLGVTQLAGDFEGFEQEQVRFLGSCLVAAPRTVNVHPFVGCAGACGWLGRLWMVLRACHAGGGCGRRRGRNQPAARSGKAAAATKAAATDEQHDVS
jgi:hypothetical protein